MFAWVDYLLIIDSFFGLTVSLALDALMLSVLKEVKINNHGVSFSVLLHKDNVTGGSVIWPMCNVPTLLHIGTKT